MAVKYVADTHAILWHLAADPRLGSAAKAILSDPTSLLVFPAIVVAEALFVIERHRSPVASSELWALTLNTSNVTFYPLDANVLRKTESLTAIPEMHDRQVVATALVLREVGDEVSVLTQDEKIAKSGLIRTVWT